MKLHFASGPNVWPDANDNDYLDCMDAPDSHVRIRVDREDDGMMSGQQEAS